MTLAVVGSLGVSVIFFLGPMRATAGRNEHLAPLLIIFLKK